jgi:DNA replication protein DnaC
MKKAQDLEALLQSKTIVELMDELVFLHRDNIFSCHKVLVAITKPYMKELGKRLQLNGMEVLAFSLVFKRFAWDGQVAKSDLAQHWEKGLTGASNFHNTLKQLEYKGLVVQKGGTLSRINYGIPKNVVNDIFQNRTPSSHTSSLNDYELADRIIDIVRRVDDEGLDCDDAVVFLSMFMMRNAKLPLSEKCKEWSLSSENTLFVSLLFAHVLLQEKPIDAEHAVAALFKNKGQAKAFLTELQLKNGPLFQKNIVRQVEDEFQTGCFIEFSEQSMNALFDKVHTDKPAPVRSRIGNMPIITATSISEKTLHYNPREEAAIQQLSRCLQVGAFQKLRKELKEARLSSGFTVLLYGGPGTGKTETALQLARATGRDILKVDISTIREKFVGESEKQVKRIFDTYREHFQTSKEAPILLLNEADGIISTRTREVQQSTDQMHNAMQNIFLEEMENFDGILIATTNYESKWDPAFERRFLHKIKMDAPSAKVRAQIISDRIPGLSEEVALKLCMEYNLSGGQLDNIARKYLTSRLMNDSEPSFDELESYFASETFTKKKIRATIGFKSPDTTVEPN